MGYGAVVSPRVSEFISQLPFELAEGVWDHIEQLLADPVRQSAGARAPRSSGLVFEFSLVFEEREQAFRIFFHFLDTADENQIRITHIQMRIIDA
jgi:hypothetical protein